jgi:hypothetical protein
VSALILADSVFGMTRRRVILAFFLLFLVVRLENLGVVTGPTL